MTTTPMTFDFGILSTDNGWSVATALLLIVIYSLPMQFWRKCTWCQSSSNQQQQQPTTQSEIQRAHGQAIRKVTISLPHPPTDSTEVSEETEFSEMTEDGEEDVSEVFENVKTTKATIPVLPSPSLQSQKRPVVLVGSPLRLADIPESPCPLMNCTKKLKDKLLRHSARCNRSVASGSSSSASRESSRRRNKSVVSLPKLPAKDGNLRRYRSADSPTTKERTKRDAFLLNRISLEQGAL